MLAMDIDAEAVERPFTKLDSLSIKDLGAVSKFLGMRVAIDSSGAYVLDQAAAFDELLREHGLKRASTTRAPISPDCYDVPSDASALLSGAGKDGAPSISTF